MKPLFWDDKIWAQFEAVLRSWVGTRYRHYTCVKGRGVDCSLFASACLREFGVIENREYAYYPRDWHIHTHDELVLEAINDAASNMKGKYRLKEIITDMSELRGDIVVYEFNKKGLKNHLTIFMENNTLIHAMFPSGVAIVPVSPNLRKLRSKKYRIFIKEDS